MEEQITLRSLVLPVYLPALLYGIGQGAIAPIVVLSARDLGASIGVASLVVALAGLGQLLSDLPAGSLAGRIGERRAMVGATCLVAAALVLCIVAGSVWLLGAGIFLSGVAGAVWGLARHAYLTEAVPYRLRARALSALGGTQRIGMFIGPFLGAVAVHWMGTDGSYLLHIIAAVIAVIVMITLPEPEHGVPRGRRSSEGTLRTARAHLPVLRTMGTGALLVGAVRASRQVVIPLWGDHIGLQPTTISVIFGVAGAVDMLLFYPAGAVMDRVGRTWVAVPCMAILGASHLLLPLTGSAISLAVVAMVMGVGNGIGSGIIMTLGADLSPSIGRSEFLGAWRFCADTGGGAGPLAISAVSAFGSLAAAVLLMGGVGLVGAGLLALWVPKHVPSPRRRRHLATE